MGLSALQKLEAKWQEKKYVCIGLDPDISKLPSSIKSNSAADSLFKFNKAIIDATADLVCAYKPQISFYEAAGLDGWKALEKIVSYIKKNHPDICIILDAKRADIGSTNQGYVSAYFDRLDVDAVTVHPYLGKEAIEPFLARKDKLIIVLARTSNEGAGELQDLKVGGKPLYQIVAGNVAKRWNSNNNCAVVVGATYPKELKEIRNIIGDMPILIPGVGAQGGDVEASVKNGLNSKGGGIIISSSRAIIYASKDADFAEAARAETIKLHESILNSLDSELTPTQKKLAIMLRETGTEAKVIRRRQKKDGSYEFFKVVRKTSPIDFRVHPGEFVFKHHDKTPNAPLSPMYVNLRSLPPVLLKQIAKTMNEMPFEEKPDFCSGIPNAGDPLAESFSKASGIPLIKVFDKDEVFEGDVMVGRKIVPAKDAKKGAGKKLLIIDDLITKAGSKIEAVEAAISMGYKVVGVAILVDRQEGGAEEMAKKGYKLYAAMKLKPMLKFLTDSGKISSAQYQDTLDYLALSKK